MPEETKMTREQELETRFSEFMNEMNSNIMRHVEDQKRIIKNLGHDVQGLKQKWAEEDKKAK